MKVYVLSYFTNGEREENDGVYGVYSTLAKAWSKINEYIDKFNEEFLDYDIELTSQTVFTDKGTYLIEVMILDDEV